jgi:uncharacterized protein YndB with AHSA1/START domain
MQDELRKVIIVEAPPEVVFRTLTDEKELVQWMPEEARMGGEYRFKYRWAEKGIESSVSGRIIEFVPGRRLSYTWEVDARGSGLGSGKVEWRTKETRPQSIVSWNLEELPGGRTKVTLVQSGLDARFSQDAENGWTHFMAQLVHHCSAK